MPDLAVAAAAAADVVVAWVSVRGEVVALGNGFAAGAQVGRLMVNAVDAIDAVDAVDAIAGRVQRGAVFARRLVRRSYGRHGGSVAGRLVGFEERVAIQRLVHGAGVVQRDGAAAGARPVAGGAERLHLARVGAQIE
ncbi:MAG: hypothetical protein U1F67_12955 [Rubrivivax sp.]